MQLEVDIPFLAKIINKRLDKEHDLVGAVTGDEGYGKSTLGVEISKEFDAEFNFERNVAYIPTSDEMSNKFNALKPKQVFLVDEAIKILYKLKWQDRQKVVVEKKGKTLVVKDWKKR